MNKKKQKLNKKLTLKDCERMWGEDGPYSQVRLCEETRILDDSVSRVFLVVEAEINPFTFEWVEKNRKKFSNDLPILQLLDHAEYRGEFGYVVSAGEVELEDEESRQFAREQADMTTETLIRMHRFIMEEFNLQKVNKFGIIADDISKNKKLIWNENVGAVEVFDDELWGNETLIGSALGIKNNKIRFFVVLVFEKNFDFKKAPAILFAKILKKISESLKVEIEDINIFQEYAIIEALIPFDIAPADFIETFLDECITERKTFFQKDYFVTNVKKPTQKEIMSFLGQLPLDDDLKI